MSEAIALPTFLCSQLPRRSVKTREERELGREGDQSCDLKNTSIFKTRYGYVFTSQFLNQQHFH
jgi:hypothetical protein